MGLWGKERGSSRHIADVGGAWPGRVVRPALKGSCGGNMYCWEADMLLESCGDVTGDWNGPRLGLNSVLCEVFCERRSDWLSSIVDERAMDETVDGRSEEPPLKFGQNMLPSTSGRSDGNTDFWRFEKAGAGPCPGKTTCGCWKPLVVKVLLGVSEAAVLGRVSIAGAPLKCRSKPEVCLREESFFLRAKSFIFEPRLRFRSMCMDCGDLHPIHCDQSFSFVGKLWLVLHLSQSNSPVGSSGQDRRC